MSTHTATCILICSKWQGELERIREYAHNNPLAEHSHETDDPALAWGPRLDRPYPLAPSVDGDAPFWLADQR